MVADFTRWNRPGLNHIRYVDANAVTFLERLRQTFATDFPDWDSLPPDPEPSETPLLREERLQRQYRLEQQDWAWEVSRSFARTLHVVTEYADAYANEGFLATATQWDHVRRLAAMVGYAPKPATSAETLLVLEARTAASVARGFQVKHLPANGDAPVVFETLQDIDIDPDLNALRVTGWNINSAPIDAATLNPGGSPWIAPEGANVFLGQVGVLRAIDGSTAQPVSVTGFDAVTRRISISDAGTSQQPGLTFNTAVLDLYNAKRIHPLMRGAGVVWLGKGHGFAKGHVAVWEKNGITLASDQQNLGFSQVTEANAFAIRIDATETFSKVGRAAILDHASFKANDGEWRLAANVAGDGDLRVATAKTGVATGTILNKDAYENVLMDGEPSGAVRLTGAKFAAASVIWFATDTKQYTVEAPPPDNVIAFDAPPPALAQQQWVILNTGHGLVADKVLRVEQSGPRHDVALVRLVGETQVQSAAYEVAVSLRPEGFDFNFENITTGGERHSLVLAAASLAKLKLGQKLVLENAGGSLPAVSAIVTELQKPESTVVVAADGAGLSGWPKGALVIRGNAVDAGHGESKPVRILGSGSGELINQEFLLDVTDVSTERDSSLPGGLRSALQVVVGSETYAQLPSLRDAGADASAYTVAVTDSGALVLRFGDGRKGRRLPTGINNILCHMRRGSGLSGNVAAFSLDKISVPHAAVESFRQPLSASGGDAREALQQVASNAPARLRALDRAVTVKDYERLASQFGGVWHATATEQDSTARNRIVVTVVLVPAGGGALGNLRLDVEDYLKRNGVPQAEVKVTSYVDVPLKLDVMLRVDGRRFDPAKAAAEARAALLDMFHLRKRRPGQLFYVSEAVSVLEAVTGVVNSDVSCSTSMSVRDTRHSASGKAWVIVPHPDQVLHIASSADIGIETSGAES